MKLYLCRDKYSDTSRYIVYDKLQQELYKVVGKYVRSGERMCITKDDLILAKLTDTKIAGLRSYYVRLSDDSFHIIVSKNKNLINISIRGLQWHVVGDLLKKSYSILDVDNSVVATVCRQHNFKGEAYMLDITEQKQQLHCIAIACCIDSIPVTESFVMQTI